jgi:adenylate cyclase
MASVAGVTFPVLLVARQLGRAREAVEQRCRELAEHDQFLQHAGCRRRPSGTPSALYGFTHALYHNVIYERVGEAKRRRLHRSMAIALEKVFQEATEEVAAELALHFDRGGDQEPAARYLTQAAQKAIQQSAYQEAISTATRGLELLKTVPQSSSKTILELKLQSLVGIASASADGYSTQTAKNAFDKALALSKVVNNKPLLFHPIVGVWLYYLIRGVLPTCLDLSQQMLSIAEQTEDSLFFLIGHLATGVVNFYLGDFAAASQHLDESSSYDLGNFDDESAALGWNPGLVLACYKSLTLQLLGYPEKARQEAINAFCIATELAAPIHTASTAGLLARFYMYRADPDGAMLHAESAIKLSNEYGFSHWRAAGTIIKGWSLVRKGQVNEGGTYLEEGIGKWRSMGAERSMPGHSALLAEFYLKAGQFDEAIRSVEEGLAIRKKTGDSAYAAELYRIKGEVLTCEVRRNHWRANIPQAEECFRQAIHTARRQYAKSLELRAIMSLCSVWQKIGKKKEAKTKLAKIYGWFTEGFDTPDLKAAKELLTRLG